MSRAAFVLQVLLSHWRRHPMQLATLVIGLMAATALWSGVQAINAQARASYDRAAEALGAGTAMLVPESGSSVPLETFGLLRRAGWPVSPLVEGRLRIGTRSLRLLGIEPVSLPRGGGAVPGVGARELGGFLSAEGQTLVARETAAELGAVEGTRLQTSTGARLPPLHIVPDLVPDLLVTDIGFAQPLLNLSGRITRFTVDPNDAGAHPPLEATIGNALRLIEAGSETDLQRLTASFHLNLTAFGLLSFLVGLFIVHSAIGLAFEQRLPMLRTLRAFGVTARALAIILVIELVLIALVAGIGGVIGGYAIAARLLPDVAASLRGLYGASVPGELSISPQWWLAGLAMCIGGALAAAIQALVKVVRLPLLVSAQPVAWEKAQQRALALQAVIALGAFLTAAALLVFGTSTIAGFAVLAGILVGAALLLPVLLAVLLRAIETARLGAVLQWSVADSRRQLSGLSLALMALLLALSVNVGVATMVGSFRTTFVQWLEGRLAAEIYVAARDDAQAADIARYLRSRSDVRAVLPGGRTETTIGRESIEVLGLADDPTFREQWPLLQTSTGAWDRLRDGSAVLASEQLSLRLKLRPGDRVTLSTPTGPWPVEVAAIYADYGNARGQVIANIDQLLRHFPNADHSRLGARASPQDVPAIVAALRERFRLPERNVADQATVKTESRKIFERTFTVTSALDTMTMIVAGIALLTSLLTLGESRLPQLAPLWAMGLTRRRLAFIELAKTAGLALVTALLALPLGIVVAWCLIEVVNVKAFGWRLPLRVDGVELVELLVLALVAAIAAAALPMIKLGRTQPVVLLKIFADER